MRHIRILYFPGTNAAARFGKQSAGKMARHPEICVGILGGPVNTRL
jgi:hypothetical protein